MNSIAILHRNINKLLNKLKLVNYLDFIESEEFQT